MAKHDQTAVIEALADGSLFRRMDAKIERIDTHAAIVFLVGERAYKMKRAVRYSFLDFSTLAHRHEALETELELNRANAPSIYRRVVAVTRAGDGRLVLDGEGEPVEWLLEMARFDQDLLLDRIATREGLARALVLRLGEEVARFHDEAPVRRDKGGRDAMAEVVDGNRADFADLAGRVFGAEELALLDAGCRAELADVGELLDRRREEGRVRLCHGDLHLGNIVLLDGRPVLFDRIEFNLDFACIDVLYDLAFLVMDLLHRGLRGEARELVDVYLDLSGEDAGMALMPLFLALRAAIRAKVEGFAVAMQESAEAGGRHRGEAARYLTQAIAFLSSAPPRLVAIGGLSGTGKTTLARALAPDLGAPPGAVLLRSDVTRKRLFGVAPTERLPQAAYDGEVSARVFAQMAERAEMLLRAGRSVVVDGVYGDPDERARIEAAAEAAGVPFRGLWLEGARETLLARVGARTGDASDADAAVVARQFAMDPGRIGWTRVDAAGTPEAVAARAHVVLHEAGLV